MGMEDSTGGECSRRRSHTPCLRPPGRQYHILVYTTDLEGSNATGEVAITLYGSGDPPRRTLRHTLRRSTTNAIPFHQGKTDCFILTTMKDIGILSGIRIGLQDEGSKWHLHHVEVWDAWRRERTFFMCRRWLGTNSPHRQSKVVLRPGRNAAPRAAPDGEIHCYKVTVVTANERGAGLGTDAEVDIVLLGLTKASGPLPLVPSPKDGLPVLQRGSTDTFFFDLPFLGEISRVEVIPKRPGSEGPWHLRHVEVTKIDAGSANTHFFTFDSTIPPPGRPTGQGVLLRPGPPIAESPEADRDWKYEVAIYTSPNSGICPPAEVVLGLWGEENPNGAPALRRLLQPCWKSSWAPVLHHTESCALLAATQKSGQQCTASGDMALSSLSPLGTKKGNTTTSSIATARPSANKTAPVEVRRSVQPLKRNRSRGIPAKDGPGTKPLQIKREKPSMAAKQKSKDPFEVLRTYGLLDGMESLFGDAAESRSILSSGLGDQAEQLLSIKNSFCQTWLNTARHEAGAAACIGMATDVVQTAEISVEKAERQDQEHPHSGFDTDQGESEGASYRDDAFEVELSIASDNYNDEEFEEAGGSIACAARESMDVKGGTSWATAGRKETPPNTIPGTRRPPVQGQFAPGSLLVYMVDAGGLGNLRRLKLEARGAGDCNSEGHELQNEEEDGWRIDRIEVWDRDSGSVSSFLAGPSGKVVTRSSRDGEGGGLQLSAGRSMATYDVSIHTGDYGIEGQVYLSLHLEGAGSPWPILLTKLGHDRHAFRPQSCERFAVTIPDCGIAPDGIKLICGNVRCIGGGSGWQIDSVLLGRAGNDSGQRFAYSGVEKLLKENEEVILELPVDPIVGLPKNAKYSGPCKYKVSVQTGNVLGAGTRATVWIVLYGRDQDGHETSSGALRLGGSESLAMMGQLDSMQDQLECDLEQLREELMSPKEPFERGKLDHFLVESPRFIGKVDQILLWTDGEGMEPDWHCHQVEVQAMLPESMQPAKETPAFFPCLNWLCEARPPAYAVKIANDTPHCGNVKTWVDLRAGNPAGPLPLAEPSSWKYRIEVYTTQLPLAGTDAEVFITLHSAKGESGPHELTKDSLLDASRYDDPNDPDLFEPGHIDVFVLDSIDLGTLSSVTIGHYGTDCNAAWHLDKVIVVDQHPVVKRNSAPGSSLCKRYHFECDRWLAKVAGSECTTATLKMSRPCARTSVSLMSSDRPAPSHYATSARYSKKGVFTPALTISELTLDDVIGPGGARWMPL